MNSTNLIEDLRLLSPPSYGWVFGLVAAALGGALLLFLFRRWTPGATAPAAAGRSAALPWELALAELERLSPLLRMERSRDYAIAATGILRGYVETRYGVRAPRQTTEEFLVAAAASSALPPADRLNLGHFLELCDLCKFGRFVATVEELRDLHAAAVAFVLRSRPPASDGAVAGAGEESRYG